MVELWSELKEYRGRDRAQNSMMDHRRASEEIARREEYSVFYCGCQGPSMKEEMQL